VEDPQRDRTGQQGPSRDQPHLDRRKGLLDYSVWRLLLWIILAMGLLVVAERLGVFGV
jgi:hypothetical protein